MLEVAARLPEEKEKTAKQTTPVFRLKH
jgi:hypothetical protein